MSANSTIAWVGVSLRVRTSAAARLGITLVEYDAQRAAGQKWCTRCKQWHPISDFAGDRSRGDGLSAACARSRYVRSNVVGPGARERRVQAALGLSWCRGCRAWLPSTSVASGACRDHLNAEARKYYARNPRPVRMRKLARKRRLAPIPAWWADERLDEFGCLCAYGCGRRAVGWDHIWPVIRGGRSTPGNLVPACPTCNSAKKDRDPAPWVMKGLAAFPLQWFDIEALAIEHGTDQWRDALVFLSGAA